MYECCVGKFYLQLLVKSTLHLHLHPDDGINQPMLELVIRKNPTQGCKKESQNVLKFRATYSFILRPIMADEEAELLWSSSAEAVNSVKLYMQVDEKWLTVTHQKLRDIWWTCRKPRNRRDDIYRVTSLTILDGVVIEFLVGLLSQPEFLQPTSRSGVCPDKQT